MCGIAGILARERDFSIPENWIRRMMRLQAHRGPDDAHLVKIPGCLFGFNRLSIQDVSDSGRQPMKVEGSCSTLVFNGEIYNFVELREQHRSRGIRFRSRSDTEVLLHTLLWKRERSFADMNGMFAFGLYDPESEELFAARDRFGVKPFYYYHDDSFFCFASEIKALLDLPFVPRQPNLMVLFQGMFERGNDRSNQTCFERVLQLKPAHFLRISRRNWTAVTRRYWSIPPQDPSVSRPGPDRSADVEEEFRELFQSAVSLRLRSDRPVGLLLSGGLDSSSIAAALVETARRGGHSPAAKLPTFFTLALPGEATDESAIAQETSRFLGVRCVPIRCDSPDLERLVPATLWHNEEPLPYLNRCVHWHVMERVAAEGLIVSLNGQGGDECAGGYYGRLLGCILAMALRDGGIPGLLDEWKQTKRLRGFSTRWMLSQLPKPFLSHRLLRTFRGLTHERGLRLATLGFIEAGILRDHSPRLVRRDFVNDQLLRWLTRDTVPDLCHYEDRNSAAHGLEERFPFLDYRIAEFMFRLPWTFKTYRGTSKVLVRRSMRGRLPSTVLDSYRKIGMEVPEDKWVRGSLAPMIHDMAGSRSFRERGLWRSGKVRALIDQHMNGVRDSGNLIWRIIGTELWFRMFIDGESVREGPVPAKREGAQSLVGARQSDQSPQGGAFGASSWRVRG